MPECGQIPCRSDRESEALGMTDGFIDEGILEQFLDNERSLLLAILSCTHEQSERTIRDSISGRTLVCLVCGQCGATKSFWEDNEEWSNASDDQDWFYPDVAQEAIDRLKQFEQLTKIKQMVIEEAGES